MWDVDTFVRIMLSAWNPFYHHLMNSTTLQLHVWLEIKWHYFQLSSVVFRFELQLFAGKCTASLVGNQYSAVYSLASYNVWI